MLALTSIAASAQDPRPASVQVAKAQVRELAPSVHAAGLVRSRASADLAASVPGRLQWVAEAGSIVEAGAVVARLDTREMALARAEQAARVNRAAVNLKGLDRELERLRASGNAVSRFAVDQAQSNRDLAAADLEVARAQLAQTDDQLARSRLTAPFAGVVSDRVRRAGEEVARGEIVARLVNPGRTGDPPVRAAASRTGDPPGSRGQRDRRSAAASRRSWAASSRPAIPAPSPSR